MAKVRILAGTRKGGFILSSDSSRSNWEITGPFFAGWEIYHMKGSPLNSDRIYASQSSGWFGQHVQRSDDGGATWNPVGNQFTYKGPSTSHQWYDGSIRPWEFKRVWHIEPSHNDPDSVYAGVEDAALFKSTDGGNSWDEIIGLRNSETGPLWQPGAGGMCLHTIITDPIDKDRIYVAISAAGVFRTTDDGQNWKPINKGLVSNYIPDPTAEVGHCVHKIALHRENPQVLYMQKHWDVMRSENGGDSWYEISGNLPSDFGFVIDIHAHNPDWVYVIPITSDSQHFPPDGSLRVYRSKSGGGEWESLTNGLPQKNCYVNILRDAMTVDNLDDCGIYFGTTGGQIYASKDSGDNWDAIVRDLPPVLSLEVQSIT